MMPHSASDAWMHAGPLLGNAADIDTAARDQLDSHSFARRAVYSAHHATLAAPAFNSHVIRVELLSGLQINRSSGHPGTQADKVSTRDGQVVAAARGAGGRKQRPHLLRRLWYV
jgi:hypothetical protein